MAMEGLSVIAVIPARGGSKGIPRKNLRHVAGHSLVARAAMVAQQLPWLDAAVLSTDDDEIATEGRRHGLAIPFVRPAELATDAATGLDTWRHAWLASEKCYGRQFDCSVLLQPTSPLRRAEQVEQTLRIRLEGGWLSAVTVSRVPGHYVPEKLLRRNDRGVLTYAHPSGPKHSNRQTAPEYFTRNGICYAARREAIVDRREIIGLNCAGVLIGEASPNIDDPIDLDIADWLARGEQNIVPVNEVQK